MMNLEEYKKFKSILEKQTINTRRMASKIIDTVFLSNLIVFLNLTKEYDRIEKIIEQNHINSTSFSDLYNDFRKVYGLCRNEIDAMLFENFNKFGYVYHITKTEHVDSILKNGILTLNKRFNQDVYTDCCEMNQYWRNIARKNEKIIKKRLIEIPDKSRLYKKRFNSIYLTTNIREGLTHYGDGMEFFSSFLDNLLMGLFDTFSYELKISSQETIKNQIIVQLKNKLNVEENEMNRLLDFFDKYYEPMLSGKIGESSIILVPKQNLINKNVQSDEYQYILKDSYHFYDYFINCNDMEYQGNISNEGLIAITMEKNESPKFKVKVKQSSDLVE